MLQEVLRDGFNALLLSMFSVRDAGRMRLIHFGLQVASQETSAAKRAGEVGCQLENTLSCCNGV